MSDEREAYGKGKHPPYCTCVDCDARRRGVPPPSRPPPGAWTGWSKCRFCYGSGRNLRISDVPAGDPPYRACPWCGAPLEATVHANGHDDQGPLYSVVCAHHGVIAPRARLDNAVRLARDPSCERLTLAELAERERGKRPPKRAEEPREVPPSPPPEPIGPEEPAAEPPSPPRSPGKDPTGAPTRPPTAPRLLIATANGPSAIDLGWKAPAPDARRAPVTGYRVEWSPVGVIGYGFWTTLAETGTANLPPVVDEVGRRQRQIGEDPCGQTLFVDRRALGKVRAHPEPALPHRQGLEGV